MSASKFALYGIGTALFRAPRTLSSNPPPLLFSKPSPPKTLRFHRCSSSAAVNTVAADNDTESLSCVDRPHHHPWPEWVSFVDRLKIKGYLTESPASSSSSTLSAKGGDEFDASTGVGVTTSDDSVYRDMNLVKNACLSFARDRYDVFKSLSVENIQTVVKAGCPNILRKGVNSAKRLRAYVRLDEGDVCSTCNLRGSCDRAYVILKEFDEAARTVDIVRILLYHALDPLVVSGGKKPPGREDIESSARRLLSELIELSEASVAPAPPKIPTKHALRKDQSLTSRTEKASKDIDVKLGDWKCPKCNFMNFSRNLICLKCQEGKPSGLPEYGMTKGDWTCSKCSFVNFSRNIQCLKCNTEGPNRVSTNEVEKRKGDWDCPKCSFVNFSRNIRCLKCNTEGPKRVSTDEVEKKKGDWDCPRCGFMNFASNRKCLRCPEPRPTRRTGEWNCPKCDFLNFERNKACLKCNAERPLEQPRAEDEHHTWIRPN